jgi:hypothetical protein
LAFEQSGYDVNEEANDAPAHSYDEQKEIMASKPLLGRDSGSVNVYEADFEGGAGPAPVKCEKRDARHPHRLLAN